MNVALKPHAFVQNLVAVRVFGDTDLWQVVL